MILNEETYRSKVLGCWLGKNIGGTLGAPFEWRRQVNDISFYTQDLGGEPLPNDDLDIQLLWLVALEERGVDIDAKTLSDFWLLYVTPHWSEYGAAKANLRVGLLPPLSGTVNNEYKDSCGAFIRSEIWACIAPGAPQIAARYAYEDAIIDHGNGEGTYAEVFCAAMESAAFVESDIPTLVEIGLSYIPDDCGVAGAVRLAMECHHNGMTWQEARDTMLEQYRGSAFFMFDWAVSDADKAKGFFEGKRGWDVPSNIGMLLIGLLYGEGDFAKSICTAVNCGEDTDCTGATVGALFGILHGAESIPDQWVAPIGRTIKTACLNLGELGYFGDQLPRNVDVLTARTEKIAREVIAHKHPAVHISADPTNLDGLTADSLKAWGFREELYANLNGPVFHFPHFSVGVDYGADGPFLRDGEAKTIRLRLRNTYKLPTNVQFRWYLPEGVQATPTDGVIMSVVNIVGSTPEPVFTLTAERVSGLNVRAVVELSEPGWPHTMLVPITLLNGNLQG